MPSDFFKASVPPALRPASDLPATGAEAAVATTSAATGTSAIKLQSSSIMKAEDFEEDWQRLPGDVVYLRELLHTVDAPYQRAPALSSTAANGSVTSTVKGAAITGRRDGGKSKGQEEEDYAAQRMREKQIEVIERRRRRAQCRCDAVDAAFARSIERRIQAMRHLSQDPPAERLVGQGMIQYVPAALLPDSILDADERPRPGTLPLLPHSVVETYMHQQLTYGGTNPNSTAKAHSLTLQTAPAIADNAARPPNEPDALVFLTQLDAGGTPGHDVKEGCVGNSNSGALQGPSSLVEGGSGSRVAPQQHKFMSVSLPVDVKAEGPLSAAKKEEGMEEDDEHWMRPSNFTATNKDRWHELGYHVVVVGGSDGDERAAAGRAFQAIAALSKENSSANAVPTTSVGPRQEKVHPSMSLPSSSKPSAMSQRGSHGHDATPGDAPWKWPALAPLPPVCLIQRRLPEEDMTAAELRHQQPPTTLNSRRRLVGGGDERPSWKVYRK
ncbi:hypothetical protein ABL78_2149 [Leptomonas seymouri]|uniref:Uncharacterized protein n=1 Tax=Leptomonas seymouri TaxID=5684 RepID=A0A0N1PCW8_LEPSE|nr:hypothetical protein ABL78_2149 [Leptomonas seymouri]|eukprot:KPI88770.1 hypothetical protein ABL78_2149 [Leptomonas seymouri]